MLRATLKGVMARKVRLLLSLVAVALSVAFVAGTMVFTATLGKTFDDLSAGNVGDVMVQPKAAADGSAGTPGLTPDLVSKIRPVDGVERVRGELFEPNVYLVDKNNKLIGGAGAPSFGGDWTGEPAQNHAEEARITQGHAPAADGEVIIDSVTFKKSGYEIGNVVKIVTPEAEKPKEYTLVGVFEPVSGGYAGASILKFTTKEAQKLLAGGKDAYSAIRVTIAPGQTQDQVAERIKKLVPADDRYEVLTGKQAAEKLSSPLQGMSKAINIFLLVFAGVALVVGGFLILNTFRMIVAQRAKEMALFRAMGSSKGQVLRAVLLEATLVGFAGASLGILLGIGLAALLKMLMSGLGLDLSSTSLQLTAASVIWSYVVGIGVTVISAMWPAWKASRVSPVRAMADSVEDEAKTFSITSLIGLVLGAIGAALLTWSLADSTASVGGLNRQGLLGIGLVGILLGSAILSPVLGRPIIAGVGFVYQRLFGTVGKLAETNAVRAPGRTAATATALMIGVTLVVGFGMIASSMKATFTDAIGKVMSSDFMLTGPNGSSGFSPEIARKAEKIEGVEWVAAAAMVPSEMNGQRTYLLAMSPEQALKPFERKVTAGDPARFKGTDTTIMDEDYAKSIHKKVGDTIKVTIGGKEYPLKIVAIFSQMKGVGSGPTVSRELLTAAHQPDRDIQVFIHPKAGANADQVRADLNELVKNNPLVQVIDANDFKKMISQQLDMLLGLLYGLLALAIIISVLGIINTLGLSVVERTREIGLLRAIGLGRGQLRRMIRLESVVIALLGAVMGLGLGLLAGFGLLSTMKDQGISQIVVPWGTVVFMLVASVIVGVLAALWPAFKASRQNVLEAIASE